MGKTIVGFVLGMGIALAGVAVAQTASQVSATLKVSCWSDGTMHLETVPK